MADYTLSAKITGDATSLQRAFESAQSSLDKIAGKMNQFGSRMKSFGKDLMPVSIGVAGIGTLAAKTSVDFIKLYESTMIVFDKMLGGKDAANELYSELLNVAKASTFSQETFLTAGKRLVGFGLSADQTTRYLQATANAVTAFGGSSESIDRVSYAMGKIATRGKVTMEELNMIMEAGIPATKMLANQYGVTTDELSDMISSGALPATEALDKLTDGIENGTDGVNGMTQAMGGMAAAMKGKTLTGAFDSMNSSIRSFSLGLTGMNPTLKETDAGYAESQKRIEQLTASLSTINQIIPMCQTVFQGLTDGIGKLLDKMIGVNAVFNDATGQWENVGGVLGDLKSKLENTDPEKLKQIGNAILGLAAAGPILMGVGKGVETLGGITSALGFIPGVLGAATEPLKLFSGGMNALGKESKSMKNSLKEMGKGFGFFKDYVGLSLGGVTPVMGSFFNQTGSLIKSEGVGMSDALKTIGLDFKRIGSDIGGAFSAALPNINTGLSGIGQSISKFGSMFLGAFGSAFSFMAIGGLIFVGFGLLQQNFSNEINSLLEKVVTEGPKIVADFCDSIVTKIPLLISLGTELIVNLLNAMTTMLPSVISGGIEIITTLVKAFSDSLPKIIPAALQMIVTLITSLLGNVDKIIDAGIKMLFGLVDGLIAAIPVLVEAIPQIIKSLLSAIITNLPKLIEAGIKLIVALSVGLIQAIPDLLAALPEIFMAIFEAFSKIDWLELGTNIITGIIDGLGSMLGALMDAVKTLAGNIWNGILDFFGFGSKSENVDVSVKGKTEAAPGFARGTSNFAGGPARINEGGRGELVILPGGTQVIPHDVSMKYARESAKQTNQGVSINENGGASVHLNLQAVLGTNIQSELDSVATYNQETWGTINTEATAALSTLKTTIATNFSGITTGLTKSWAENKAVVLSSITSIKNDVSAQVTTMKGQIATDFNDISTGVKKTWIAMEADSKAAWNNIRVGIQGALGMVYQTVVSGMKPSLDYIAGLPSMLYSRGKEMIMEMARGINDTKNDVDGAVGGLVDLVINKFREGFKIHSPSRVMYEIGSYLMAGLINSMTDSDLISFTKSMIEDIKGIFMSGNLSTQAVMDIMGPEDGKKLLSEIGAFGVGSGMKWPSDSQDITSLFGYRSAGETGGIGSTDHGGIDIGAAFGSNVYAALSGIVKSAGSMGGYGNAVSLDHGNGFETFYAHMQNVLVEAGQAVSSGQIIGLAGSTGNSTGPHLHYETMQNGGQLDPMQFYTKNAQGMYVGLESVAGAYQNILGDGVERWRSYVVQALAELGLPTSHPYVEATLGQIRNESGGDPFAINLWDSNAMAGYPSQGLLQTIPQTFATYKRPSARPEDITNGYENIYAAINYATQRYGSILDVWPGAGYANGGIISHEHLAMVGEGGMKEAIIPLDPSKRSRAFSLYQQVGDILGFSEEGTTQNRNTGYASSARGYRNDDFTSGRDAFSKGDIYQEINIHRPVNSPREMANELKRIEKEIAYGF